MEVSSVTPIGAPRGAFGDAAEAMQSVSRLLGSAMDAEAPVAVGAELVREARRFFRIRAALLLSVSELEGKAEVVAMDPTESRLPRLPAMDELPPLGKLLAGRQDFVQLTGAAAADLAATLGGVDFVGTVVLLPLRAGPRVRHVLVLADERQRKLTDQEAQVSQAFASVAAASLARFDLVQERAQQVEREAALARAAKTLNESLDRGRVLVRVCEESASILGADIAVVYLGDGRTGLRVEAAYGLGPDAKGNKLEPGEGLAGRVAAADEAMIATEYQGLALTPVGYKEFRSALAVPLHWDGELRGVLSLGWTAARNLTHEHLSLLTAFGELAAAAARNASVHEGLARAARTDALTGCLNHAALHDTLRRELERSRRAGHGLSLILVDLDDFKTVNERHGHLAGDEVLRRVGASLQDSVRVYDIVGRYGGDEFAVVAADAGEIEAADVASRALDRVRNSVTELSFPDNAGGATAGVAEWNGEESLTELISRADRALLYGKQQGKRGVALRASVVPADFEQSSGDRRIADGAAEIHAPPEEDVAADQTERLRKRTRQLLLANALGARLAAMTDPQEIIEAAADELHRAFGYYLCALIRIRLDGKVEGVAGRGEPFVKLVQEQAWSQPVGEGLVGRCVRERRTVLSADVRAEPDYNSTPQTRGVRSELVVPLWVGEELWGVINLEELHPNAFDEDDARLVQTVADQVGSALRSAILYQRLERAYLGTAEALGAALEAKDTYTAAHSRSIVDYAEAVGRRLGMDDPGLRTLRFGAAFHDIGKIAVPEQILNKQGPLTPAEWQEVQDHPVAGERILASVDFLSDVRPLVRHEHERYDGNGYPDGLAGEDIPLGSRIILACDAFDAMTSTRPYRDAMTPEQARGELVANTGAQFDPDVVAAFLEVLSDDLLGDGQPALSESR